MKGKSQTPIKNYLSVNRIDTLKNIYISKKWNIVTDYDNNEFDDFCEMLSCLDDTQQDLILDLTQNFIKVGISEYPKLFLESFDEFIVSPLAKDRKRIFIIPLTNPSDSEVTKSSDALYYVLQAEKVNLQKKYNQYQICFKDSINSLLNPNTRFNDTDIVCTIDDFVGTGESATNTLECYIKMGLPKLQIAVVCLVAQEQGVQNIEKNGYSIFVKTQRNRAISDYPASAKLNTVIMNSIEELTKPRENCKFGYGQAEALVKMVSTPNNTFPIYWLKSKKIPIVPFPRG